MRGRRSFVCGAICALLIGFAPLSSAAAQDSSPLDMEALTLDAGQYVWHPELASAGAVEIVVSLPLQTAYVFRGGTLIGVSTVSTGAPGYDTPTGTFPILQKKVDHRSNLYDDAPMPYMQRLTWDGVALHAGKIPGYAASHGCVRLPTAFARKLYSATSLGASVHIVDEIPASSSAALELAKGSALAASALDAELARGTR
ncbi:L,D-transpeptidase family protein [Allosphingosinicella deserti]|uniref:L,D-TPase catalytic domain-containing protein n=1 Tax=Allosphingosinicella deserti TaxID=2116704 RepID=A0A2P7QZJ8_9SPHN|nr:L,D-transpeptidase family protein [Sphingomonas deserti]PSJ43373.1 hypothetical protein C7I55_03135 [Sphingomonas deserti]